MFCQSGQCKARSCSGSIFHFLDNDIPPPPAPPPSLVLVEWMWQGPWPPPPTDKHTHTRAHTRPSTAHQQVLLSPGMRGEAGERLGVGVRLLGGSERPGGQRSQCVPLTSGHTPLEQPRGGCLLGGQSWVRAQQPPRHPQTRAQGRRTEPGQWGMKPNFAPDHLGSGMSYIPPCPHLWMGH